MMKNEEYPPGIYFLAELSNKKFNTLLKNNNIFVAGNGGIPYSENPTTFGNNIKMAMDTLCDVVSDHFSVDNINIFQSYIRKLGVEPKEGKKEFEIEADFAQIRQLLHDPSVTNYWKVRSELAEDYIKKLPNYPNLTGETWKAYQKWIASKERNLSCLVRDYNVIKKSTDGSMRVCGFIIHEKSNEFDTPARKFARVLDREGINPLLVTYSPSY